MENSSTINRFDQKDVIVLIIEDDVTTVRLLANLVEAMGGTAITAADGSEGLRMAHDHFPTVAVCDYAMEPVDGGCFLAGLRHSRVWRVAKIPVIMFTAEKDEEVVVRLRDFGANEYIAKPFNLQGFSERLAAIVEMHGLMGIGPDFQFGKKTPLSL